MPPARGGRQIADVDIKLFRDSMNRLKRDFRNADFMKDLVAVGQSIIAQAVNSPVPLDTGELARSGHVEPSRKPGEILLGFNKEYAAFQDSGYVSGDVRVVKPRRKKLLYIPLTRAGEAHQYGANPEEEGLVRGKDYTLTEEVRIKIKPYGSDVGPNLYFSETLRRRTPTIFEDLVKLMRRRLAREEQRARRAPGARRRP